MKLLPIVLSSLIIGGVQAPLRASAATTREHFADAYYLKIDCDHTRLEDENTQNNIEVTFTDKNGGIIYSSAMNTDSANLRGSRFAANLALDFANMNRQETIDAGIPGSFSVSQTPSCSSRADAVYGFIDYDKSIDLKSVNISTNGNDAFFADKVSLIREKIYLKKSASTETVRGGKTINHEEFGWDFRDKQVFQSGMNEHKGFCLSTDANGGFGNQFQDGGCNKELRFDVPSGGKAYVVERGKGELKSTGYISFFNQAGYVTEHALVYYLPNDLGDGLMQKFHTGKLSAGRTAAYTIPADATNIAVVVTGISVLDPLEVVKSYATAAEATECFKFYGTIFDTEHAIVSCND